MRRTLLLLATMVALVTLFCPIAGAQTQVNAGISVGDQGLRGFFLAIGNAYHVPERQVMVVRERSIPDDELPVVFFLAQRARVQPSVIVELRLSGMSWYDITTHFGMGSDIYYYRPVGGVTMQSPYGRAFGHYKQTPKRQWRQMRLADEDIVNLVNLRFASEHGGMNATQVVRAREGGNAFPAIYSDAHGGRSQGRVRSGWNSGRGGPQQGQGQQGQQGQGQGNPRGNGRG